jgi:hypothetical protein
LSVANLGIHNKSVESLSSVYSRSISGERYSMRFGLFLSDPTVSDRSYSAGSTATVRKSPLGVMRLASEPDVLVVEMRSTSVGSGSDIDDAATLQAKLPPVQAVGEFGDVSNWDDGVGVVQHADPVWTKGTWRGLRRNRFVVKKTRQMFR